MRRIEFEAIIGDQTVHVDLTDPHIKSNYFQVIIGGMYRGMLIYRDGRWQAELQQAGSLSQDDVDALISRIEEEYPNG